MPTSFVSRPFGVRAATDRAAYTLIEMVAVIGLSSTVLGIAAGLVQSTLRCNTRFREAVVESGTLEQLAHQLRRDVHSAESVRTPEAGLLEISTTDGGTIQYEGDKGGVSRAVSDGEEREPQAKRTFRLRLADPPDVTIAPPDTPRLVCVLLNLTSGEKQSTVGRKVRIEAAVRRDRRQN
jgi:type II secretory pathway pseudopilin PulG